MSNVLLPWESKNLYKRNMKLRFSLYSLLVLSFFSCKSGTNTDQVEELLANPKYFHENIDQLTDVIVHDIFSPPVASRVYAYPCIAAYQAIRPAHDDMKDLSQVLHGLSETQVPKDASNISYNLAALYAFQKTAKTLIFSEKMMEEYICLLYTSPSPRDKRQSRMPSSA